MTAHVYAGDLYCPLCTQVIKDVAAQDGYVPEDPDDVCTYDSEDYPQPVPAHLLDGYAGTRCGSAEECEGAEELADGSRVGAVVVPAW